MTTPTFWLIASTNDRRVVWVTNVFILITFEENVIAGITGHSVVIKYSRIHQLTNVVIHYKWGFINKLIKLRFYPKSKRLTNGYHYIVLRSKTTFILVIQRKKMGFLVFISLVVLKENIGFFFNSK